MHPRTDAVVITAVLDATGEKILLGRNVRLYYLAAFDTLFLTATLFNFFGWNFRNASHQVFISLSCFLCRLSSRSACSPYSILISSMKTVAALRRFLLYPRWFPGAERVI